MWQPKHAPAGTLMQALKHSRLDPPLCLSCPVLSCLVLSGLWWPTWERLHSGLFLVQALALSCSGLDFLC